MRRAVVFLLAGWIFCGLPQPGRAQEAVYEISHYDVVFRLEDASADALVELDITYRVLAGVKTDGFKYVGNFEPVEASAVDETGAPLPVRLRRLREYQLYWNFPPVPSGSKRVIVRFRLRDVLSGTRDGGNELSAPWVGVFRVPVRRAAYTVIFPQGFAPEVLGREGREFARRSAGRQVMVTLVQEPLERSALSLRFKPGLVNRRRSLTRDLPSTWPATAAFVVAMLGVGVVAARGLRRRGWGDGDYSGGCGGGGCGGGGCGGGCGG